MRLISGVLSSTTAAVLLTSVLLSGCGGGSDSDPESEPTSDGSPTGEPSEEEWTAAHTAYHDLGETYNAANSGSSDYQEVVRQVNDKSPGDLIGNPKIAAALEEQEALAAERDAQTAALGDEPAMRDPELKEAYDAFAAASEEMNTFQDGYNESMPMLLRSLGVCVKIFSVEVKEDELIAIPGVFAELWIKAHNKAAAPCLKLLDDLDQSANYRIRQYAANYRKVIDQRNALMADQGEGKIGFEQTVDRLERINKAFTKRNAQLTNFSDELAKLSSADEYLALDDIFEARLEPSESPSP